MQRATVQAPSITPGAVEHPYVAGADCQYAGWHISRRPEVRFREAPGDSPASSVPPDDIAVRRHRPSVGSGVRADGRNETEGDWLRYRRNLPAVVLPQNRPGRAVAGDAIPASRPQLAWSA